MLLDVTPSYQDPSGRWHHHIRQSDISTFRHCPELRRASMLKGFEDVTNDSAGLGTAVHEGIRYTLSEMKEGRDPDFDKAKVVIWDCWLGVWDGEWEGKSLNQVQVPSLEIGAELAFDAFLRWWNRFLCDEIGEQKILAVENKFDVLCYEDEARSLYLSGTQDLWLELDIWDWKTANKQYSGRDAWKYQRSYWSVQHVLYPWARVLLEGAQWWHVIEDAGEVDRTKQLYPFHYCIIPREPNGSSIPDTDKLTIAPTVGDCQFLLEEMIAYAKLIEAKLDRWPLGPTDWWCSEVWCPNWQNCRGRYLPADAWGLLAKKQSALEVKRKKVKK